MHKIIRADQVANASKRCRKCDKIKLREDFSKNRSTNDGLQYDCKQCQAQANKEYWAKKRAENPSPVNQVLEIKPAPVALKPKGKAAGFILPTIEKGVPIPPRGYGDLITKFLQEMEVNDSFVTPNGKVNAYQNAAKKVGIKLLSRNEDPLHTRVWRVE